MPTAGNLVHQTTTSTGTSNLTLSAVSTGKRTFSDVFSTGGTDVFDYFISHQTAVEWERGTGHMSDSTTLVRDTVIQSSNANAAVNFSAGTKDVANDVPAAKQVQTDLTQTLTNKRRTRRLTTTNAPGATPTTNTDNVDVMSFTGLSTAITSMTTNLSGTPSDGDLLEFRFLDNGTARTIAWGSSFASTGFVTLPTTTVISTTLRVGFEWRSASSKWECIGFA